MALLQKGGEFMPDKDFWSALSGFLRMKTAYVQMETTWGWFSMILTIIIMILIAWAVNDTLNLVGYNFNLYPRL